MLWRNVLKKECNIFLNNKGTELQLVCANADDKAIIF